jgi:hypothetical protein
LAAIEPRDRNGPARPMAAIPIFIQSSAIMQIGEKLN